MAKPYIMGEDAHMYYSATPVTTATVTVSSTEVLTVRNLKVSGKTDTDDFTTRDNNRIKNYAVGLQDLTITGEIKRPGSGVTDTPFAAIRDAWKNGTEIALYVLDDTKGVAGAQGPCGNFVISDFSRDESNSKVIMYSFEAKPSSYNSWFVDSGS